MKSSLRTASVLVGVVVAALLAGCGAQQEPEATPSSSPPATATAAPSPSSAAPSATSPGPSLSPSKGKPGRPRILSVTGTVEAGVEPGCLLLRPAGEGPVYLLIGGDRTVLTAGSKVTVRGYPKQGAMTTCQQGTPFEVVGAERA